MMTFEQPVKYGSKRLAKSAALMVVAWGPNLRDKAPQRWHMACFGNMSHYHPDTGICEHVENLVNEMKPWHRSRAWFLPFGDNDQTEARVDGV